MKKQALLIGINEYQFLPGLKYARQDAEAVANSLKQNYSFSDDEIMLMTDVGSGYLNPTNRMVIRKNLDKLANQELDLFIFGFWGHGLFRNGERYLCPLDVMGDAVEELGFSFETLQQQLSRICAKNTCMILDCCQTIHDRGEAETLTASDQAIMENAVRDIVLNKNKLQPGNLSNIVILNSCSQGQSAYEWDERRHGIFTAHLLDAMNRRFNSVSDLISYVGKHVKKTALKLGKDQNPYYSLSGDSDFLLPALPPTTGDVFISYRSHYIDLVEPILKELSKRGISYFIDSKKLKSGDYARKLTDALRACKVLLLIWTEDVNDSDYVASEVSYAFDSKKEIVPYKIGNFDIKDQNNVILYLKNKHIVEDSHDTIIDLVDSVEQALNGQSPELEVSKPDTKPEPVSPSNPIAKTLEKNKRKKEEQLQKKREQRKKELEQLQEEAAEAYEKKDYTLAISKCEAILKLDPDSLETKELSRLSQLELTFQKVLEAFDKKDYSLSASKCKEILKLDPDSEDANELLSRCLPSLLELQKAEEEKRKAEEERKKHDLSVPGTKAGERKTVIVKGVEFAFRWCPAGTFMMGAPGSTQHRVKLTKGFWMMETQVTQKQWQAVMGNNPSRYKNCLTDDNLPVEQVSWIDCQEFCKKCALLGLTVQLPTEAQWEYACRAGTTGEYAGNLDEMAWYRTGSARSVGTKKPNAWGLYDMYGNLWEWCQDWKDDYPNWSVTDPTGPSTGSRRIIRGGSWFSGPESCNSTNRESDNQANRSHRTGFRCVKCQ